VLIVDDSASFTKLLFRLFEDVPWIEVVGFAADGGDAVRTAAATKPDVILMDFDMPVMNGVEATRLIKARQETTVVVLTSSDHPGDRESLLEAGARAVLPKVIDPQELLAHLHELHIDRTLGVLGFERVPAWEPQRRQTQTESSPPRQGDRSNQP
jgi:DNA-binding NarL/FixJ family response regulator